MRQSELHNLARENTAKILMHTDTELTRYDLFGLLTDRHGLVGIELGVAQGNFSKFALKSGKFKLFFGCDAYGDDHHSEAEYIEVINEIGAAAENYRLIRAKFESALSLFPDEYFDFIYFDGYAHNGEEGGQLFVDWYPKIKPGGLVAGDDYHEDWPLVMWAVNSIVSDLNVTLNVTGAKHNINEFSEYPSWFFRKPIGTKNLKIDPELSALCRAIKPSVKYDFTHAEFLQLVGNYISQFGEDGIRDLIDK